MLSLAICMRKSRFSVLYSSDCEDFLVKLALAQEIKTPLSVAPAPHLFVLEKLMESRSSC